MTNSFYSAQELQELGLLSVGENVLISRKASIYAAHKISIGNNVRIDDFCILSGKIKLGDYIHISAFATLYGGDAGIYMDDFSGLSARTTLYAVSDDFGGECLVGSMVDFKYRNVTEKPILIGKYVQLGANCVVMPGVVIEEGCAVGAMSFINKKLEEWGIYAGIPCVLVKKRSKNLIKLKDLFLNKSS